MSEPIFTIGHSTRTFAEFAELLRDGGVQLVVDVRKLPGSTRYPQFDQDTLSAMLGDVGVGYQYALALTGRRTVSTEVPFEVNGWWTNRSFHNYADYAMSEEFRRAHAELREWGRTSRIAVMCSEAVWWRCHRRFVADYMLSEGREVFHLMGDDRVEPATINLAARKAPEGLVYPAE